MGVNRYSGDEKSVRGNLDSPPARETGRTVPMDDVADTVSLLGRQGYSEGGETDISGVAGDDPAVRAMMATAKMLEGAQELNSILPLPQELLGMLDMIRVGVPKQLEQLEASRAMLGQSGAAAPAQQFQLMGGPQQQPPAPPVAGPAPMGGPAGPPGVNTGMPLI